MKCLFAFSLELEEIRPLEHCGSLQEMLLPASFSRHISSLRSLNRKWQRLVARRNRNNDGLSSRMLDVFLRTWDLGFTSFGGPPVHFRILHERFVQGKGEKEKWVDEQTVSLCPAASCF